MKRKPRDSKEGIFAGGLGFGVVYQGVLVTIITLASYFIGVYALAPSHMGVSAGALGSTMAFLTLSMAEIFHSFNMRSLKNSIFKIRKQNWWLWGAAMISLILTTLVIEVPFLANAFELAPLGFAEYGISIALAFMVIPVVEIVKLIQRSLDKKKA